MPDAETAALLEVLTLPGDAPLAVPAAAKIMNE
jgi:hypothetical protein